MLYCPSKYGDAVRRLRKARGLTLAQLSLLCGVTESYLSQIEHGKKDPSVKTLEAISDALEVPGALLMFLTTITPDDAPVHVDQFIDSVKDMIISATEFESSVLLQECGTEERKTYSMNLSDGW